jgi:hypothetical protein
LLERARRCLLRLLRGFDRGRDLRGCAVERFLDAFLFGRTLGRDLQVDTAVSLMRFSSVATPAGVVRSRSA